MPSDKKSQDLLRTSIKQNLYLWRVYLKKWQMYREDSVLISLHEFFSGHDLSKLHRVLNNDPAYLGSLGNWYPWELAPTPGIRDLEPDDLLDWFSIGCFSADQKNLSHFYGSIEYWLNLGMSAQDVNQIHLGTSQILQEKYSKSQNFNMTDCMKDLLEVGLEMTVSNIVRWFGVSAEDILWIIDNDKITDARIYAVQFLERQKIDDFEAVSQLSEDIDYSLIRKFLEEKGTLSHAEQLQNLGYLSVVIELVNQWQPWSLWFGHNPSWEKYFDYLVGLASIDFDFKDLDLLCELPPKYFPPEVLKAWVGAGLTVRDALDWNSSGLDPEVAIKRHLNGIRPSGTRSF